MMVAVCGTVAAMPASRAVRLLEAWPDLAPDLAGPDLAEARRAVVLTSAVVAPGDVDLAACVHDAQPVGPVLGVLVVDGMLAGEVHVGGHRWPRGSRS